LFAIRLKVDRAKIEQLQRLNNIIKETPDALEMRVETGAVYETSEMRPALKEGALFVPYGGEMLRAHSETKIYDVRWQLIGEGDLCLVYKPNMTGDEVSASLLFFDTLCDALTKYEEAEKEAAKPKPKTKSLHCNFEGTCRACLWDEIRDWLSRSRATSGTCGSRAPWGGRAMRARRTRRR